MKAEVPHVIEDFRTQHPEVWDAFEKFAEKCHHAGGPLEERVRRLVKLGIAIGTRHEGAVHSAVRQALASGVTREELDHVAILAITTIGWPAARAAMTWINDRERGPGAPGEGRERA